MSDGSRRGRSTRLVALLAILMVGASAMSAPGPTARAEASTPLVRVDPAAGSPGAGVSIAGSGFVGDDCVDLALAAADVSWPLGTAFPDPTGSFSSQATVPADADPGEYTLVAVGKTFSGEFCIAESGNRATTPFVVRDPHGIEPRFVPVKPSFDGSLPDGFSPTRFHLKFVQGSGIRLDDGKLTGPPDVDLGPVQAVLDGIAGLEVNRLFDSRPVEALAREKARLEAATGREQGDKNLYYLVTVPVGTDVVAVLDELNSLDLVEIAYPVGDEPPPPALFDFEPFQGYRTASPSGIHADAANTVPGGRGQNVQITDIEGAFVVGHEDLPAVTIYDNGAMLTGARWVNHGTAVLGSMFGVDNGFGVLGLAPDAAPAFVSQSGGRADAIDVATANSVAGDVILLEMQTTGANGGCSSTSQVGCVPQEYEQASYDAVVAAVAAGIIVVGAAGNGSQNLDSTAYDPTFGTRPDSGAIIVGAGAAGSDDAQTSVGNQGGFGCNSPERGRLSFSTFGARVNLQGWGECVMTTGYGNAEGSSMSTDSYRATFNGTSSASPIVAAAAGIVSSVAQANGDADGLTSTEARSLLVATGTPQDLSGSALTGNIGPLPNLAAALGLAADVTIAKTVDADPVVAGESVGYEITVTNDGPNIATDVTVTDSLPAGFVFDTADPACAWNGFDLVCELGTLAVGESVALAVDMDVPADFVFAAGGPVTVTNTASVTTSIDDPDGVNDSASVDVGVIAVADLEVVSTEVVTPPVEALVGDDVVVTLRTVVANHGPSSPMDAQLAEAASPSGGMFVAPVGRLTPVPALSIGVMQMFDHEYTVSCTAPGMQSVTFDTAIAPASPLDSDPDPTNDTGQASFTMECIVPIAVNVRPANRFNRINVASNGKVPVAALTTAAGEYGLPLAFDASAIVPDTVRFGDPAAVYDQTGGAAVAGPIHLGDSFELDDMTRDGDDDLRLGFVSSQTDLSAGAVEACMRGQFLDGGVLYTFFGCDTVDAR